MGLSALAADYLFIAPLLQQRLLDRVPDIPVDVCETAEQVLAADRREQVLIVMYAGDRFDTGEAGRARGGASQVVQQRWLVMLALNHVGKPADARHAKAGPLLSRIHAAVAGWEPAGAQRAFRRANSPLSPTLTKAKAVYPLGFEITLTL